MFASTLAFVHSMANRIALRWNSPASAQNASPLWSFTALHISLCTSLMAFIRLSTFSMFSFSCAHASRSLANPRPRSSIIPLSSSAEVACMLPINFCCALRLSMLHLRDLPVLRQHVRLACQPRHAAARCIRIVAAQAGGVDVDVRAGHLAVLIRHLQLDENALAVPASAPNRPAAAQLAQRPAEVPRLGIRRRAFHGALLVRPLLQGIALQLPQPVLDVLQAQSLAQLSVVVGRVYARAALRQDEAVAQPHRHHRALAELRAYLHVRAVQQQVDLRLCYLDVAHVHFLLSFCLYIVRPHWQRGQRYPSFGIVWPLAMFHLSPQPRQVSYRSPGISRASRSLMRLPPGTALFFRFRCGSG
ncbi:hypothetical protein 2209_scaffold64_00112 [Bacteriophage sp.]|nr:hypothetical protein 2209_scaffold64_00112 [Bacteriophage sp.]